MRPELINQLKDRWEKLCKKNYADFGDRGSCVLGAGLEVNGRMIIKAHEVSPAQGSLVWETGLDSLLSDFSQEHGVKVVYNPGVMD